MAYSFDSGHKELVADDCEREKQVDGDEGMEYDGSMLALLLREESCREVIYGRRRAIAQVTLCNDRTSTLITTSHMDIKVPIALPIHYNDPLLLLLAHLTGVDELSHKNCSCCKEKITYI